MFSCENIAVGSDSFCFLCPYPLQPQVSLKLDENWAVWAVFFPQDAALGTLARPQIISSRFDFVHWHSRQLFHQSGGRCTPVSAHCGTENACCLRLPISHSLFLCCCFSILSVYYKINSNWQLHLFTTAAASTCDNVRSHKRKCGNPFAGHGHFNNNRRHAPLFSYLLIKSSLSGRSAHDVTVYPWVRPHETGCVCNVWLVVNMIVLWQITPKPEAIINGGPLFFVCEKQCYYYNVFFLMQRNALGDSKDNAHTIVFLFMTGFAF